MPGKALVREFLLLRVLGTIERDVDIIANMMLDEIAPGLRDRLIMDYASGIRIS